MHSKSGFSWCSIHAKSHHHYSSTFSAFRKAIGSSNPTILPIVLLLKRPRFEQSEPPLGWLLPPRCLASGLAVQSLRLPRLRLRRRSPSKHKFIQLKCIGYGALSLFWAERAGKVAFLLRHALLLSSALTANEAIILAALCRRSTRAETDASAPCCFE